MYEQKVTKLGLSHLPKLETKMGSTYNNIGHIIGYNGIGVLSEDSGTYPAKIDASIPLRVEPTWVPVIKILPLLQLLIFMVSRLP